MELVPWTYNNPRVDLKSSTNVYFNFACGSVVLSQRFEKDININRNTNFKLWDGAFLLAKYLENKNIFPDGFWRDKKCFELGSGCGLVGIVAWLLGADVTLTDLPEATEHTKVCVDLNANGKRDSSIRVMEYSWADELPSDAHFRQIDYIFGSDVVYLPSLCGKLVTSLHQLMNQSSIALISYKKRGLGEDVFFELLCTHNFTFEKIGSTHHTKEFANSDYNLFAIKKL